MSKGWAVVFVVFLLIVAGAVALFVIPKPQPTLPTTPSTSFEDCAKYFSTSGYPRTCTTNLGQTFTENIGNAIAMQNTIVVNSPKPNATVSSPVTITGRARGTYFFEGTFPVEVKSESGTIIGHGAANATQPWTTSEFVTFQAVITFDNPSYGAHGTLVLRNDNPSGDPARELELDVPIDF